MVVPSAIQLVAYNGGQMTDLPYFTLPAPNSLDLTALMEIVSPGNVEEGINYGITLAQLSLLLSHAAFTPTIILSGATYDSVATDTRILVNKTVGSATTINLLSGDLYFQPILIKDLKGDADVNPITITFPGTYDGIASPLTINTKYGWIWFNPLDAGNFYAT